MSEEIRLLHRKSPNYVNEYADRFAITGLHSGGSFYVAMHVGRDCIDVTHEVLVDGQLTLTPETMVNYRLDLATIAMSPEAARNMAEFILKMLNELPQNTGRPSESSES